MIVKRARVIDAVEIGSNHTIVMGPRFERHQDVAVRARKAIRVERVSDRVIVDDPEGYGSTGRQFEDEWIARVVPRTLACSWRNVKLDQPRVLGGLCGRNRYRGTREILSRLGQLIAIG